MVVFPTIAQNDLPVLTGPYLGQTPPGTIPEVFAPNIISTDERELNSVFNKNGKQFFFSRKVGEAYKTFFSYQIDNIWTEPEMIGFSQLLSDMDEVDMILSNDENTLLFISNRPSGVYVNKSVNIWSSDRIGENWSEPKLLPKPVNSDSSELYPMTVENGGMYFASGREGGYGGRDIYRVDSKNGQYYNLKNLGPEINTEFNEGDIYVNPQETYLIVSSWVRPDSYGRSDLYISYKTDGQWGPLENMGEPLNSEHTDYCPIVTPDGLYFFFSRNGDIYWVDATVLEKFRP